MKQTPMNKMREWIIKYEGILTAQVVFDKATELLAEEKKFAMDFATWCNDNHYYSAPTGWMEVKYDEIIPIEQSEILNRFMEYGGGDGA